MESNIEKFDDDFMTKVYSDYLQKDIMVCISDELDACEEELTLGYRKEISSFINAMAQWYHLVYDAIFDWTKKQYGTSLKTPDIELMIVYVLFEQTEQERYGLSFRLTFDIEHGCGVQIVVEEGQYSVIKIGSADVAFEIY